MIRMISKSRSSDMRHVSRTHRVDLDRSFDQINLDQAIKIKYVNTNQQFADVLPQGSLSQDRWTQLTQLLGFMSHQTQLCSHFMVLSSFLDSMSSAQERCQMSRSDQSQSLAADGLPRRKDGSEAMKKVGGNEEKRGNTAW